MPFSIDLEPFLAPISATHPCGESLRYDPVYDQIKAARTEDDPAVDHGVWQTEPKRADWALVEQLCLEALETRSKDLQLAAWLAEAWLKRHSFGGLAHGLALISELCDSFWDCVHPQLEGDDVEFRLGPIYWINEKLPAVLLTIPITNTNGSGVNPVTFGDWEQMNKLSALGSAASSKKRPKSPGPSLEERIQKAIGETDDESFYVQTQETAQCLGACDALTSVLSAKLGRNAPGFSRVRAVLEGIHSLSRNILLHRGYSPEEMAGSEEVQDEEPQPDFEETLPRSGGPIRNRLDAYRRLEEAADFLMRTEPHSPTPYLVRRAIAWGNMRFDELLAELAQDGNQLNEAFRLLRINPRQDARD